VDGLRLRDAGSLHGDASGLIQDLLFTNSSRIEVMNGAGSSLYGTNAMGGVVNVLTDDGGGRTRGTILAEGGSLGAMRGRASLAGAPASDRIQYSAGLAHVNVTSGVDGDDPFRNTSLQGRISFRLSPSAQLSAGSTRGRLRQTECQSRADRRPAAN
jgi:outer membrane cobalamin receptor